MRLQRKAVQALCTRCAAPPLNALECFPFPQRGLMSGAGCHRICRGAGHLTPASPPCLIVFLSSPSSLGQILPASQDKGLFWFRHSVWCALPRMFWSVLVKTGRHVCRPSPLFAGDGGTPLPSRFSAYSVQSFDACHDACPQIVVLLACLPYSLAVYACDPRALGAFCTCTLCVANACITPLALVARNLALCVDMGV